MRRGRHCAGSSRTERRSGAPFSKERVEQLSLADEVTFCVLRYAPSSSYALGEPHCSQAAATTWPHGAPSVHTRAKIRNRFALFLDES